MVKTWSCPTIACTIRSSITPPIKQQFSCNSFNQEDIVYNVDVARNVAIICGKSDLQLNRSLQNLYHLMSASLPNIHLAFDEDEIPLTSKDNIQPSHPMISAVNLPSKLVNAQSDGAFKEDSLKKLPYQGFPPLSSTLINTEVEEEDKESDSEEEIEVLEIVEYTEKRCTITAEELERCAASPSEEKLKSAPHKIFYNGKQEETGFNSDKSNGLGCQQTSSLRPQIASDLKAKNINPLDISTPNRCHDPVILPREVVPSIQR